MSSSLSKLWERTAIVAAIAVGERTYCSIHSIQSVGTLLSLRQLPIECKSVRESIGPWLTVYYELFNSRLLTDSFTILPVKLKLKISVVKKPLQFYGLLSWWLARLIRFEQLRYRTYTNVCNHSESHRDETNCYFSLPTLPWTGQSPFCPASHFFFLLHWLLPRRYIQPYALILETLTWLLSVFPPC